MLVYHKYRYNVVTHLAFFKDFNIKNPLCIHPCKGDFLHISLAEKQCTGIFCPAVLAHIFAVKLGSSVLQILDIIAI